MKQLIKYIKHFVIDGNNITNIDKIRPLTNLLSLEIRYYNNLITFVGIENLTLTSDIYNKLFYINIIK